MFNVRLKMSRYATRRVKKTPPFICLYRFVKPFSNVKSFFFFMQKNPPIKGSHLFIGKIVELKFEISQNLVI